MRTRDRLPGGMLRTIRSATLALALCGAAAQPALADRLTLEHYLNWEDVQDPQISPDGASIVFTRRRVNKVDDRWDSELWRMGAKGERLAFLATGGTARWSPTGDRIAYIDKVGETAQLKIRYMDAAGATTVITRDGMHPIDFSWAPDGKSLAFRAETPAEPDFKIKLPARPKDAKWTADAVVIERLHYREDRVGYKTGYDHIFIVPADGGTPRQVTKGRFDIGARMSGVDRSGRLEWTPDGRSIVFDGLPDETRETEGLASDISIVDVATGAIRRIQAEDGDWNMPRLSPNGRMIAYVGSLKTDVNYPALDLRVMNSDGSGGRVLVANLPDAPRSLEWDSDGRTLYYSMNKEGSTNLVAVDMAGKTRAVTTGVHQIVATSVADTRVGVGVISAPNTTPNVARIDFAKGAVTQLTDVNADILANVDLGKVEELRYTSNDGTPVQGWYVLPPNFDPAKKYPLILSIHGGPHSMYGVGFSYPFQEFASRGYVVLYTNPRGSTGYTPAFANAIDNQYPGRPDYEDLMSGVDALLQKGFVDANAMYVTGCSGGGILTAWIVTRTDRFKAAAALCPVINWISLAGTIDVAHWGGTRHRPYFWEDATKWLEHSPIMHVENVKTPTLLMTGDRDLRTPLAQAEEFYSALKRLGVPTKLIAMKNEFHGTSSIPSNMLRTQLYLGKWFETYGGVAMDAVSDDAPAAGVAQATPSGAALR